MALALYDEATFSLEGEGWRVAVSGEGRRRLPPGERNAVLRAFGTFCDAVGAPRPAGLRVSCRNGVPVGSGLGSSAAAALLGLLGANALLGAQIDKDQILQLAAELEGHADNAAAALYGGLALAYRGEEGWAARRYAPASWQIDVILPRLRFSTRRARALLPREVPFGTIAPHLARVPLVIEALQSGDLGLLRWAMQDGLHQPYRLKHIGGAEAAYRLAWESRQAAVALSGAGPALILFSRGGIEALRREMEAAFSRAEVAVRHLSLAVDSGGARAETLPD
jgi:homoserine kinase